jgi:hypothetical protein
LIILFQENALKFLHLQCAKFVGFLIAVGAFAASTAFAQPKATYTPPSVEDIWRNPQLADVTLSKSGRYVAATAPARGKMNIVVIDMETRKGTIITGYENYDVVGVRTKSWTTLEVVHVFLRRANARCSALYQAW